MPRTYHDTRKYNFDKALNGINRNFDYWFAMTEQLTPIGRVVPTPNIFHQQSKLRCAIFGNLDACAECTRGLFFLPRCFFLVMDPLLRQLQSRLLGISVNNSYTGGYLHVDGIRTLASSTSSLEAQIPTIMKFTSEDFLN